MTSAHSNRCYFKIFNQNKITKWDRFFISMPAKMGVIVVLDFWTKFSVGFFCVYRCFNVYFYVCVSCVNRKKGASKMFKKISTFAKRGKGAASVRSAASVKGANDLDEQLLLLFDETLVKPVRLVGRTFSCDHNCEEFKLKFRLVGFIVHYSRNIKCLLFGRSEGFNYIGQTHFFKQKLFHFDSFLQ